MPSALRSVEDNDLSSLGLSDCTENGPPPAPSGVSASVADGTFTIAWSAVTGAGLLRGAAPCGLGRRLDERWDDDGGDADVHPRRGSVVRHDLRVQGEVLRRRIHVRRRMGHRVRYRLGHNRRLQPNGLRREGGRGTLTGNAGSYQDTSDDNDTKVCGDITRRSGRSGHTEGRTRRREEILAVAPCQQRHLGMRDVNQAELCNSPDYVQLCTGNAPHCRSSPYAGDRPAPPCPSGSVLRGGRCTGSVRSI